MMKAAAAVLMLFSVIGLAGAAQGPVVFFSDLISGPPYGGEDEQGVYVTLRGKNFGASRGTSFVTVGGGKASRYLIWSDTAISFQPGPEARCGFITVTTLEGTSEGVPFAVRGGDIYFVDASSPRDPGSGTYVDPWRSPASFLARMKAGDTCYFRAGTYGGAYSADNAACNINLGENAPSGMRGFEIALVAYPGETVRFAAATPPLRTNINFGYSKYHYVLAGFTLYASGTCVCLRGENLRVVNTVFEGLKEHSYAMLSPMGVQGCKIYGCEFRGAASADKLDHPLYVGYGTCDLDFGWNWLHDNDVAEGPLIMVNEDNASVQNVVFRNIRIHDNVVDCRNSSTGLRALGIVATGRGSSVYVYNNVFIQPGGEAALYLYSGSGHFYHNTIFRSGSTSAFLTASAQDGNNVYVPENVEIKNNIITVMQGEEAASQPGGRYVRTVPGKYPMTMRVSHNCYYGSGAGPSSDPYAANADPMFASAGSLDLHLLPHSPCIDAGDDTVPDVPRDRDGVTRRLFGSADIGAYEAVVRKIDIAAGDKLVETGARVLVVGSSSGRGTINPDRGDTAKIYFKAPETGTVELRIYTLLGEEVWREEKQNVREGMFEWHPRGMASGIYVVSVRGAGMRERKNIAVIR